MSSGPRISHNSDSLSGQQFHTAHGTDKHGGYQEFNAVSAEDAAEGLQAKIDEANEDEEDDGEDDE